MASKNFNVIGGYSVGNAVVVIDANSNVSGNVITATANVTAPQIISNVATGTAPLVVTSTTQVANLNAATAGAATTAGTVTTAAQPNITSVGTLSSLAVTANANVGNLNSAGRVYANDNILIGSTSSEGGQLVLGYAGTNNFIAQANSTWSIDVDSSNTFRIFTQYANGAASTPIYLYNSNNNIVFPANASASYFIGNGSQLTGITASFPVANGTSNINAPASGGNINISVAGNANVLTVTGTGITVPGTINVTGNTGATGITVGNGAVSNCAIAMVPTAGTAAMMAIRDYSTVSSTIYFDVSIGNTPNGSFQFRSSNAFTVLANISNSGLNLNTGVFTGNGSGLSAIAGANVTGTVSSATTAGTVTTSSQPNITSVGTLSSLAVTGAVTGDTFQSGNNGNGTNFKVGDDIWIGDVNQADTLSLRGVANAANGYIVFGNADVTTKLGRAGSGPLTYGGAMAVSANITTPQFISNVATGTAPLTVTSTTKVANLNVEQVDGFHADQSVTANTIAVRDANGNISANYFVGNGSTLTAVAGANVTGAVAYATTANSVAGANVSGAVAYATTANSVAGANVSGAVATATAATNASALLQNTSTATTVYPTFTTSSANGNSSAVINTGISANLGNASITATTFVGALSGTASAATNAAAVQTNASTTTTVYPTFVSASTNANYALNTVSGISANLANNAITATTFVGSLSGAATSATSATNAAALLQNTSTATTVYPTFTTSSANGNSSAVINTGISANLSNASITATTFVGNIQGTGNSNVGNLGTATAIITANANVTANVNAGNANVSGNITAGTGLTVTTGGMNVTGNINVTGNFNVTGNLNYSNVTDLVVGDPLIYMGANNTGNLYDLGIVASYNDGTYKHTGLARNHNNGYWTFFDGVVQEPTTVVDWANATYPTVKVGSLVATSTANITGNANVGNLGTAQVLATANITAPQLISNVATGTAPFVVTSTTQVANLNAATAGSATSATTAGTVTTAAQPNITSVGTLTSLGVSGAVTASTLVSNVATGTAPLTVTSTTKVGNLNVEQVDGYHADITATASNITVRDANANIYGNNFIGTTYTSNVATGTAPLTVTSTTRVSNLNVSYANVADFINVTAPGTGTGYIVFANATTGNVAEWTSSGISSNLANNSITATTFVGALSGAATSATTAGTVTTAAQPNITSVGTLTSLAVTGNVTGGALYQGTPVASTTSTLQLNGDISLLQAGAQSLIFDGYYASGNWRYAQTGNYVGAVRFDGSTGVGKLQFWISTSSGTAGANADVAARMTIDSSGNVGIGNSSPTNALSVTGNSYVSGYQISSVNGAVSAAGTVQGNATVLASQINVVSTVASGAGVQLPTAVAGMRITVMNTSANALLVYPAASGIINSAAANAAYSQPAGARLDYIATSTTQWYTLNATYG